MRRPHVRFSCVWLASMRFSGGRLAGIRFTGRWLFGAWFTRLGLTLIRLAFFGLALVRFAGLWFLAGRRCALLRQLVLHRLLCLLHGLHGAREIVLRKLLGGLLRRLLRLRERGRGGLLRFLHLLQPGSDLLLLLLQCLHLAGGLKLVHRLVDVLLRLRHLFRRVSHRLRFGFLFLAQLRLQCVYAGIEQILGAIKICERPFFVGARSLWVEAVEIRFGFGHFAARVGKGRGGFGDAGRDLLTKLVGFDGILVLFDGEWFQCRGAGGNLGGSQGEMLFGQYNLGEFGARVLVGGEFLFGLFEALDFLTEQLVSASQSVERGALGVGGIGRLTFIGKRLLDLVHLLGGVGHGLRNGW